MDVSTLLTGPINRVSDVQRYSSHPVIKGENVAEHSYFVAMYSLLIADSLDEEIDLGLLLQRALVHDIDESVTGDFVRNFKYSDPELHEALDGAAREFVHKLLLYYGDRGALFQSWVHAKDASLEGEILRLADYLSVVAYITKELSMGNLFMRTIFDECITYGEDVAAVVKHPKLQEMAENAISILRVGRNCHARYTD